jgi:hypothetical protein
MSTVDLSGLVWRKSSRSGSHVNDACVEVAFSGPIFAVRDSKNPTAGVLSFPTGSLAALLRHT